MKFEKRIWTMITSFLLVCCFLFSGCVVNPNDSATESGSEVGGASTSTEEYCTIAIAENENCEGLGVPKKVVKGEDVVFTFTIKNGFTFDSADYADYEVTVGEANEMGVREVSLTLHSVKYNGVVVVTTKSAPKVLSVSLASSEYFRCEDPEVYVMTGGNVDFVLYYHQDYTFESVDYEGEYTAYGVDSEVDENNERRVVLTLKNVTNEKTFTITSHNIEEEDDKTPLEGAEITYYVNGGSFINGVTDTRFKVAYSLTTHLNPNVSIATDTIERAGYVQIGWNTMADGTGTHIGLGSKAPIVKGERLKLYAEWEKCTEASSFEYALIDVEDLKEYGEKFKVSQASQGLTVDKMISMRDDGTPAAVLTRYVGEPTEKLVIPEKISGYDVVGLNKNFMQNDENINIVVLPKTIRVIEGLAFNHCDNLREIYLYDNIQYVRSNALGTISPLKTMHINAIAPPLYTLNETGQLATKIEQLRNRDESRPKIVVFGSCSTWYGVNAREMKAAFTNHDVYNMGIVGGTSALYQIDLIRKTLNKGDVFMHITELASEYQWFGSVDIDNRTFASLESNYDLLAELDLQRSNNVFTGLGDFLYSKKTLIEVEGKTGSYDDYLVDLSPEGDMLKERAGNYDNGRTGYELPNVERYTVVNQYTGKDPFTLMKEVYTEIKAKTGSDVYFGFGPMNSDLLVRTQALEIEELFLEKSKEKEIPMIFFNAVTDGIMDEEYFFDTNYHLSTEGATVFTENIIYNMAYLLGYSL